MIDEFDEAKKSGNGNEPSLKIAKFFKEHPLYLIAVLLIGASAVCARSYCMHTAGKMHSSCYVYIYIYIYIYIQFHFIVNFCLSHHQYSSLQFFAFELFKWLVLI